MPSPLREAVWEARCTNDPQRNPVNRHALQRLHDEQDVPEGTSFDDWLRWFLDQIPDGRRIEEIRLYAYCSPSAPVSGYEPSIRIAEVTGVVL